MSATVLPAGHTAVRPVLLTHCWDVSGRFFGAAEGRNVDEQGGMAQAGVRVSSSAVDHIGGIEERRDEIKKERKKERKGILTDKKGNSLTC